MRKFAIFGLSLLLGAPLMGQICVRDTHEGSQSGPNSSFGHSVSYWGTRAIVGAYGEAGGDGAAYIYEKVGGIDWVETQRIAPPVAGRAGQFGWDVAIFGDFCVIGAPREEDASGPLNDTGAAYVYRRIAGNWVLEEELLPGVLTDNALFGLSVACHNLSVVVSAPRQSFGANPNVGTAFIFRDGSNGWGLEEELLPQSLAAGQWFGTSVAISGETVAVGAPYETNTFFEQGGMYLFRRLPNTNWTQDAHFNSPSSAPSEYFGISVDISGNRTVVGEEYHTGSGVQSGAAHLYERPAVGSSWAFHQTVLPSVSAAFDTFGNAVAIDNNHIVVSARGSDLAGQEHGAAFIFGRNPVSQVWEERAILAPETGDFGDLYSNDVDISGLFVMIGASASDGPLNQTTQKGSMEVAFWVQRNCLGAMDTDQCLIASGLAEDCNNNIIPDSCEIADGNVSDCNMNGIPDSCDVAAGMGDCDSNGVLDACEIASDLSLDCNFTGSLDVCDLATGASSDFNGNGIPDECENLGMRYCDPAAPNSVHSEGSSIEAIGSLVASDNDLTFFVTELPPNQFAIIINGQMPGFIPFPGGSAGILCLGGTLGRHTDSVASSGAFGIISYTVDLTNIPTATGPEVITAGETWYFQSWNRDFVNGASGTNFSDALELTFQ